MIVMRMPSSVVELTVLLAVVVAMIGIRVGIAVLVAVPVLILVLLLVMAEMVPGNLMPAGNWDRIRMICTELELDQQRHRHLAAHQGRNPGGVPPMGGQLNPTRAFPPAR
jgi:hypothetical protein